MGAADSWRDSGREGRQEAVCIGEAVFAGKRCGRGVVRATADRTAGNAIGIVVAASVAKPGGGQVDVVDGCGLRAGGAELDAASDFGSTATDIASAQSRDFQECGR